MLMLAQAMSSRTFSRSLCRSALLMGAGYFVSASATLLLTRFDGGLATVWLAGALLFASLCSRPRREWRILALSCIPPGIAAAMLFGFGRGTAIPMAMISIVEPVAAAWLVKRSFPRFGRFESMGEAWRFLAIAGLLLPLAGGSVAAACAHWAAHVGYWETWLDWVACHGLGMVAFGPAALLTLRGDTRRWIETAGRAAGAEAILLIGAVVIACILCFGQNKVPLVLIPLVPMLAATFRMGRFGAVSSVVILMSIGMGCSLAGLGSDDLVTRQHGAEIPGAPDLLRERRAHPPADRR